MPEGEPIATITNHQCLFLSSFDRDDPRITAQMHLDSAKQNLANNFFFVGITERLDESIDALYKLMGWQPPETIPKLNVTEKTEDVSLEIREELIQRNWADIELYEFAKTLFEAKLAELRKDHGDSL